MTLYKKRDFRLDDSVDPTRLHESRRMTKEGQSPSRRSESYGKGGRDSE